MRERWNLNGEWGFQIDPLDQGETENWFHDSLNQANEVTVPHIWQREGGAFVDYYGSAWYQRRIMINELDSKKDLHLCFEAVDFLTRVWMNGNFVGEHEGGFTPFEFNVTDKMVHGENTLTVKVFDPEDNAEIPIGKQGSWYTRVSGIWQNVYLEERSKVFINEVFVTPNLESNEANVLVELNKETSKRVNLQYTVTHHLESQTHIVKGVEVIRDKQLKFNIPIKDPILWEAENPHLYDLTISLGSEEGEDRKIVTFGMREVSYQDGKILLNGEELFLRGALDQAFYPDTIYTAPSDEFIQKEIRLAKEMGFNMLRKHIKIEIPRYLYWADRMGLFIWEEPPNYVKWTKQGRDRFTKELVSMVIRDYNHPSILIWSLYNEEWGLEWDLANDKEKQSHVELLYDQIKTLDSSRLICDNSGWTHVRTDINDYHRYFVAPDQVDAWKHDLDEFIVGDPGKNFVEGRESKSEPIIVSEFGVWGLPSVKKLKEYYKGEPWWFINQGDNTHKEDYKSPLTAEENFQNYGLNKVFNSFEELAVYSQKRMFRGIKSIIEEMRKRPAIKGYIVTEFTDIEWETNGWLDYLRNPKEGFESLKDFNGDLVVMLDNVNHNLWCGEQVSWNVLISNHRLCGKSGVVTWSLSGTDLSGVIPVNLKGDAYIRLDKAITFIIPDIKKSDFYKVKLELQIDGKTIAENYEELTISVKEKIDKVSVHPYSLDEEFVRSLEENGFHIKNQFDESRIVITNNFDKNVEDFAHNGGQVIFLAEEGDQLGAKGSFTFRHLPEGESWQRTASFNFVNLNEFRGIPLQKEMGWEVEALHPRYIIPFSNYYKEGGTTGRTVYMFGNSGLPKSAEILSGYFEGWVGQGGASMIKKRVGKGSLTLTTWQVLNHYNKHPIATQLVNHIIKAAIKE